MDCFMDLARATAGARQRGLQVGASLLHSQLAHEVALAERYPFPPEDVVSGCRVKVKVGLREGEQKILRGEIDVAIPKGETHVATDESLDLGRLDRLQRSDRLRDPRLERG